MKQTYLMQIRFTDLGRAAIASRPSEDRQGVGDVADWQETVSEAIENAGGILVQDYFVLGDDRCDQLIFVELGGPEQAAQMSLWIGATGLAHVTSNPLLTGEQFEIAARRLSTVRQKTEA